MSLFDKIKNKIPSKDGLKSIEINQDSDEHVQIGLEIKLPGCDEFVPFSKFQYKRVYLDDLGGRLLLIFDEVAELAEPTGLKTTEGKEEDAMKNELMGLINSITRLGRSAGIHCMLCTQRNDASLIAGAIQNNPLSLNTKLRIRRETNE